MSLSIHIVEPTLEGQSGHCHSFLESLCSAASALDYRFTLWVARKARLPLLAKPHVQVRPYFYRTTRRVQALLLLRRLLSQPGRIFLPTAERTDLYLLNLASGRKIPQERVYLYFHWVRRTERKLAYFRKVAGRHPDLNLFGPTSTVVELFRECGFRKAKLIPYPLTPIVPSQPPVPSPFKHLLFAGAAREDKGFSRIVAFMEYLVARGEILPFSLQTSADHYGKYDPITRQALTRLRELDYPMLREQPATLDSDGYLQLFQGGICLQLYHQADFADRISGITLDALSMGCPVITLAGTWMARMVERFGAGRVVAEAAPAELLAAVQEVIERYSRYQARALIAGSTLQAEHHPTHLLKALTA